MVKKWIKQSEFSNKWVNDDISKCASFRWENKKIYDNESLYSNNLKENVELIGVGKIDFENDSIILNVNDDIEDLIPRPNCTIKVKLNNHDYTKYNRISLKIKPISTGFVNFYLHISFGNDSKQLVHAPSVTPNIWNHVMFELDDTPRDNVNSINITPFLFGTPPEALPDISFIIKDIYAETVDADYSLGWELGDRIAYSHVGYFKNAKKEAIAQNVSSDEAKKTCHKPTWLFGSPLF